MMSEIRARPHRPGSLRIGGNSSYFALGHEGDLASSEQNELYSKRAEFEHCSEAQPWLLLYKSGYREFGYRSEIAALND